MANYQLTDRKLSRLWRRGKDYSGREIRWLVRRRGLELVERGDTIQVVEPKTKKVVANFRKIPEADPGTMNDKARTFAALKLGTKA